MTFKLTMKLGVAIVALSTIGPVQAHFPWLVRNADGTVAYFFGEGLKDRTYHMPDSLSGVTLLQYSADGTTAELPREPVDRKDLLGLISTESVPEDAVVAAEVTYGIYHGSRLTYSSVLWAGELPKSVEQFNARGMKLGLRAVPVATDQGIDVTVFWRDEPLKGVSVQLISQSDEDHDDASKQKTDAQGKTSFTHEQLKTGWCAILVGHTYDDSGELDGAKYTSASHYLTLTFVQDKVSGKAEVAKPASSRPTSTSLLAPMPSAITSFGAARLGDSLYVYGGHTGEPHTYSKEGQSNQLLRLDLTDAKSVWQEVATGERLQGLAMVAHDSRLIVIGGLTALNAEGDPNELESRASVRAFDTANGQWSDLPSLPEPRSSHDAALIGDTIYVVGGWDLHGQNTGPGQWHTTALALDLSSDAPSWKEVATPPFTRRALALVSHQDRLYAIGGMDEKQGPSREVDAYDPQSNQWVELADLPIEGKLKGFGAGAWSVGGKLVVTTHDGDLQVWEDASKTWTLAGKVAEPRFFHRLLPLDNHRLVAIGGANMEIGKFQDLEVIQIQ